LDSIQRKRGKGMLQSGRSLSSEDTFKNKTPIEEPMEALWLLVRPWRSNSVRKLLTGEALFRDKRPYVRIEIYGSGYTKEEFSYADEWLVTDDVVRELISLRYVQGTPEMGYTDNNRLIITERGTEAAYEYRSAKMIRETISAAEKAQEWWYVCDRKTSTRPVHAFLMAPQSPEVILHRGGDILVRANEILKALNSDIHALENIFGTGKEPKGEDEYSSSDPFEKLQDIVIDAGGSWTALAQLLGKKLVVFYDGASSSPLRLERWGEYLPNS